MLRGAPIDSLWYAFVILAVMAVVVFTAATLRFRRDLAPGPPPRSPVARAAPGRPDPRRSGSRRDVRAASATVRFGDVVALDDVTVEVPGGSVVAVVGGDGAGKTTLLRALVGEVPLDAGEVAAPPTRSASDSCRRRPAAGPPCR